jgi:ribosomal protein S18 acetylase RimI-like enzyme
MVTQSFNITSLNSTYIAAYIALQNIIYQSLSEADKEYILPRSEDNLQSHFAKGNQMLGIQDDDQQLSGAMLVAHPDAGKMQSYVGSAMESDPIEKIAIIEGLYVCPSMRRHGFASSMILQGATNAIDQGHTAIWAEVAKGNEASYGSFVKNGFVDTGDYISPEDGCVVNLLRACPRQLVNR